MLFIVYYTLYTVSLSGLVSIQVHATYFTVNIIFHLGKRLLEIASFVPSLILDNNLEMNNNYEHHFGQAFHIDLKIF